MSEPRDRDQDGPQPMSLSADIIIHIGQMLADDGDVRTSRLLTTCTTRNPDVIRCGRSMQHPVILKYRVTEKGARVYLPMFHRVLSENEKDYNAEATIVVDFGDGRKRKIDTFRYAILLDRVYETPGVFTVKINLSGPYPESKFGMKGTSSSLPTWTTYLSEFVSLGDTGIVDTSLLFAWDRNFNLPLNHLETGKIVNMAHMFQGVKYFNQPLDRWNTCRVVNMSDMFKGADCFNQDITCWDTSSVKT